ncbi:ACP phosphodiesterase [Ferrimonas gelatinilytica]|uniref:ACP phosphodiesterase n=1 Tax=Ferrimonas gelatinilytica TaxID=1255257 RepID=A0ABP9S4P4_9GAMM
MNFLAHLYIAEHTSTDLAGSVAADFVRGPLAPWPEPLRTGMALHRFVDAWVDRAPEVLALKGAFLPQHRRVAGILLDLAFDHQLVHHWPQLHSKPLDLFIERSYQGLLGSSQLPAGFAPIAHRLAREDWLSHYHPRPRLEATIARVARRLSRPEMLTDAQNEIWRLDGAISSSFLVLWPQLLEACHHYLGDRTGPGRHLP